MRTALASNPNEQTTNVVALTVELLLQIFPDTSQNPTSSMQQIVQNLLNQGALGKNMIWYRLRSCLVIDAPLSSLTRRRQTTGWTLRARSTGAPAARATYEPKRASWVAR